MFVKSKVAEAYDYLKEKILSGHYKFGEVLSANGIVEELGMSRTPILEAFRILENEGLVKVIPQVGVLVNPLDVTTLKNRDNVLAVLEGYMAGEVAKKRDPKVYKKLEEILKQMEGFIVEKDYDKFSKSNRQFHETIWEAANNDYALNLIRSVKTNYASYLKLKPILFTEAKMKVSYSEHLACYRAMITGDIEQARKLMESHILRTRNETWQAILQSK